jgi:hypothetical protein
MKGSPKRQLPEPTRGLAYRQHSVYHLATLSFTTATWRRWWTKEWVWNIDGMILTEENWSTEGEGEPCPSPTLSTTNFTEAGQVVNPGFLSDSPADDRLSHGMAPCADRAWPSKRTHPEYQELHTLNNYVTWIQLIQTSPANSINVAYTFTQGCSVIYVTLDNRCSGSSQHRKMASVKAIATNSGH